MIDHLGITVGDIARATEFFTAALEPLGYGIVMQVSAGETGKGAAIGFGPPGAAGDFQSGKPSFWIGEGDGTAPRPMSRSARRAVKLWMPFTAPRSLQAAPTTDRPACARNIMRATTPPSSSIPTATTSRPSLTPR